VPPVGRLGLLPTLSDTAQVMAGDVVRVVVVVLAALLGGAVIRVVKSSAGTSMTRWQRARFACLLLAVLSVAGTEVEQFHQEVTWRLPVNLAFVVCGLYGVWAMRQGRDHAPD